LDCRRLKTGKKTPFSHNKSPQAIVSKEGYLALKQQPRSLAIAEKQTKGKGREERERCFCHCQATHIKIDISDGCPGFSQKR